MIQVLKAGIINGKTLSKIVRDQGPSHVINMIVINIEATVIARVIADGKANNQAGVKADGEEIVLIREVTRIGILVNGCQEVRDLEVTIAIGKKDGMTELIDLEMISQNHGDREVGQDMDQEMSNQGKMVEETEDIVVGKKKNGKMVLDLDQEVNIVTTVEEAGIGTIILTMEN